MKITEKLLKEKGFKYKNYRFSILVSKTDDENGIEGITKTMYLEKWGNEWDIEIEERYNSEPHSNPVNICTLTEFKDLSDLYFILSKNRI